MRRKKKLKIIKTYLLVGILNLIRFFIKHLKSFAHKIYSNIDWKYYKKEQFKIDPKAEKWAKHNCFDNPKIEQFGFCMFFRGIRE